MRNETTLGKILKEKKLTVNETVELTGIPLGSVIQLIYNQNDYTQIKVDTLIKLCIGLNIKAIDLFPNEEEKARVLRLSRKSRKKTK